MFHPKKEKQMGTEKITGTIAEFFKFNAQNTDWRTEITGGVTTFVTMAYIVAVNPGILSDAQPWFSKREVKNCTDRSGSGSEGTWLTAITPAYEHGDLLGCIAHGSKIERF